MFCWFSYCWFDQLGVICAIGGSKITLENIRRNDEVLIVNKDDKLLACGKSLLSSYEIKDFNTGQAIKTRKINNLSE